jgi:hypothetical protein
MPRGVAVKDPDKEYLQVKVDKDQFQIFQALLLLTHKTIDATLDNLINEYIQKNGKELLQLDKLKKK